MCDTQGYRGRSGTIATLPVPFRVIVETLGNELGELLHPLEGTRDPSAGDSVHRRPKQGAGGAYRGVDFPPDSRGGSAAI